MDNARLITSLGPALMNVFFVCVLSDSFSRYRAREGASFHMPVLKKCANHKSKQVKLSGTKSFNTDAIECLGASLTFDFLFCQFCSAFIWAISQYLH
jgi:hypothetical protein